MKYHFWTPRRTHTKKKLVIFTAQERVGQTNRQRIGLETTQKLQRLRTAGRHRHKANHAPSPLSLCVSLSVHVFFFSLSLFCFFFFPFFSKKKKKSWAVPRHRHSAAQRARARRVLTAAGGHLLDPRLRLRLRVGGGRGVASRLATGHGFLSFTHTTVSLRFVSSFGFFSVYMAAAPTEGSDLVLGEAPQRSSAACGTPTPTPEPT